MSIPVPLDQLRTETDRLGPAAYFLTTNADGRPHCVAVIVNWSGDELEVPAGNTTVTNAGNQPLVSLLWAAPTAGDYSLIVDADVTTAKASGGGNNTVLLRPTKAVFHRPAVDGGHDCVPVYKLDEAAQRLVDEQGDESFPASDPPSNWAGEP